MQKTHILYRFKKIMVKIGTETDLTTVNTTIISSTHIRL